MKKYSVEIEFPAYYYADAKFVPHYDDLIVDMSYHIIPLGSHHNVQTTKIDGRVKTGCFEDLYKYAKNKHLILKLQRYTGRKGMV